MPEVIRILHIEDVATDAELVQRALKKAGLQFEACVVDEKETFINALTQFKPQVILSDHSMPYFDSVEALELLQEYDPGIPFILVTATVSEEFAVDMIKRGASDYLLKDRLQRLPNAIITAVEKRQMQLEHHQVLLDVINSEALLNDAETLAQFGSFEVNPAAHTIKLSNQFYRIFGFNSRDIQPVCKITYNEKYHTVADKIHIALSDVFIDLISNKKSYTIIDKNGRLKFLSAEFRIDKSADGSIHTIKGFLLDVTKLKYAESLLQQSEANLKTIFSITDTGYVLMAHDQKVILFNKKAAALVEDMRGIPVREGAAMEDYVVSERKEFVQEIVHKIMQGENVSYENRFVNKKGETKWYLLQWYPVTGDNQRRHGIMLALSDITERKILEIEREQISADLIVRNKALEQFAYIVSHNLRAPVANIIGISNILAYGDSLAREDMHQFLQALSSSTKHLDGIVNDLNHILRITHGVNEEMQPVNFQQLVDDIKTALAGIIKSTHATINTCFKAQPGMVAVKSFLHYIFYNLILNSLQFVHPLKQPCIFIEAKAAGEKIELIFRDNGCGIDMDKYGNKIFGLYQRVSASGGGKGMGLCIVKTLVDNMGGHIKAESALLNGTTFYIDLPA
ncbi:MAG TPA: ATP-binding protein [Chitinophagaceae bacterium]|nr:ATP-binding protein [Chitinophagaceae bacterium]